MGGLMEKDHKNQRKIKRSSEIRLKGKDCEYVCCED
jgi:hypothetical protein